MTEAMLNTCVTGLEQRVLRAEARVAELEAALPPMMPHEQLAREVAQQIGQSAGTSKEDNKC